MDWALTEMTNPQADAASALTRTGYSFNTITLKELSPEHLRETLEVKIAPNREIYAYTPIVLDISAVSDLGALDYARLSAACADYDLYLLGLSGVSDESTALALRERGVPVVNSNRFARVREENFKPRVITRTFEVKVPVKVPVPCEIKAAEPLLTITRNIRTGESITARDNSVAIFGNVARTARVIASHNILIFGGLYGEVYAGSPKNSETLGYPQGFIYAAGTFSPTLCAICGKFQTADDMEHDPGIREFFGKAGDLIVYLSADGKSLRYSRTGDFIKSNSKL